MLRGCGFGICVRGEGLKGWGLGFASEVLGFWFWGLGAKALWVLGVVDFGRLGLSFGIGGLRCRRVGFVV